RHCLLRLDNLNISGDAGRESVARLRELLGGQVTRLGGGLELIGCRLQIQIGRTHFVVDRRLQVFGLVAPAAQVRVGFEQASSCASSLKDGNLDGAGYAERAVRVARRQTDVAEIGVEPDRRKGFADDSLTR